MARPNQKYAVGQKVRTAESEQVWTVSMIRWIWARKKYKYGFRGGGLFFRLWEDELLTEEPDNTLVIDPDRAEFARLTADGWWLIMEFPGTNSCEYSVRKLVAPLMGAQLTWNTPEPIGMEAALLFAQERIVP